MSALDDKISESGSCSSQTHREKKTYSVQEIADILQISKNPEFRIIRLGRTIRVSKASFDEWLNNLL